MHEQIIYITGILSHILLQDVSGMGFVSQHICTLHPQLCNFEYQCLIVVLIVVITTIDISVVNVFSEVLVFSILKKRRNT